MNSAIITTRHPLIARAIFFGFATSLAGWILAYALRLPGDVIPALALGLVLIVTQFAGAWLAGRSARFSEGLSPLSVGLGAGLVTSALNLLIVLSAFSGESPDGEEALHPLYAIAVYLPLGAALGAFAGWLGGRTTTGEAEAGAPERNWLGRFAVLNAVGAFILLIAGGIVTSADAGLAVPDWPASFGANMFLFPLSKMTGGVFIEHAHRLLAVLVASTTAALLVWTLLAKVKSITKLVAVIASALVIAQAIMGGLRVTQADGAGVPSAPAQSMTAETLVSPDPDAATDAEAPPTLTDNPRSRLLRLLHGIVGQLYVASLALLAAMLSTRWRAGPDAKTHSGAGGQRTLNLLALIALVMQIGFGAAVRHFDLQMHALASHLVWSIAVLILLLLAGVRAQTRLGPDHPILRRAGVATKHTVLLQMGLGVIALIGAMLYHDRSPAPALYILMRTPHQAIGALLLITATLLTAWTLRLTARETSKPAPSA